LFVSRGVYVFVQAENISSHPIFLNYLKFVLEFPFVKLLFHLSFLTPLEDDF